MSNRALQNSIKIALKIVLFALIASPVGAQRGGKAEPNRIETKPHEIHEKTRDEFRV